MRYASRPCGVNCAPTSAGLGAVTVPALPTAAVIASTPAADRLSVVLVTTSTLYGSAGAAFGCAAAVAGTTRARLNSAAPNPLLFMTSPQCGSMRP